MNQNILFQNQNIVFNLNTWKIKAALARSKNATGPSHKIYKNQCPKICLAKIIITPDLVWLDLQ